MQQLTVSVPDNKIAFFMDLAKNLGFSVQHAPKDMLTEKQVEMVNEARKGIKDNPSSFLDWDDARKMLKIG